MKKNVIALMCALAVAGLTSGCDPTAPRHHKKVHSRIYESKSDGAYYARTYDNDANTFVWWMYVDGDSSSPSTRATTSTPSFTSGSWQRASAAPTNLAPTSKAVAEDEKGNPTEEVDEAASVSPEEMVEEDTTTTEAEAAETDATADSATGSEGTSGGESAGDAGAGSDGGGGGGDGGD